MRTTTSMSIWLSRCFSAWLTFAALAALNAQTVEVWAPRTYLLAGRSLTLTARAFNGGGATVRGFTPEWRSMNPEIADVDSAGIVLGLLPGVAEIEAGQGGIVGRLRLLVYPAGVAIKPESPTLSIGESVALTANALDADGNALAGLRFTWSSSASNVVSISEEGTVKTEALGSTNITATLAGMPPEYDFSAQVLVTVRARPDYTVKRLLSSDTMTRPVTVKTIGAIGYSGGERMVFSATLSNGGLALMSYYRGRTDLLASTGQWLDAAGSGIRWIGTASVNEKGDVLAGLSTVNRGDRLALFRDSQPVSMIENAYIGLISTNDRGDQVYRQWNGTNTSLYFKGADGAVKTLFDPSVDLPGFGRVNNFPDPYLSTSGQVLINAYPLNGNRSVFVWDGTALKKIYTTGETIAGTSGLWFDEARQSLDGDVYFRFGGNGFWALAKWSKGVWSIPSRYVDGGAWSDGALDYRGDSVLLFGNTNTERFLMRIKNGATERLLKYGPAEDWRSIDQAFIWSDGSVVVRGATKDSTSRVARISGSSVTTLLDGGASLDVAAATAIVWDDVPKGNSALAPVFATASRGLARVRANGIEMVAGPGDTLADGPASYLSGVNSSRNGDAAFVAERNGRTSVHAFRNGVLTKVADSNGETVAGGRKATWIGGPIALNNKGQVVFGGHFGIWELLSLSPGAKDAQTVFRQNTLAPEGGIFTNFEAAAVDESGRIAVMARTSTVSRAIYISENGQGKRILAVGDKDSQGRILRDMWRLQAAGDRFQARVSYTTGPVEVAEYSGGAWRTLVVPEQSPAGPVFNYMVNDGRYSSNTAGDTVYGGGGDGQYVVLRRKDGRETIVATTRERLSNGDWITSIIDWSLSEQGDVFFTATSPDGLKDRTLLYQATPAR
ncbi:MAG: hypothetical protein EXQ52_16885 [Bryobacterales bacterium]|nr:hypothetical protein [Bryobacterales bacterium]